MTRYGKTMMEALSEVREGYSPKQIKMAIGIASDKRYAGGNMSGAVAAIEKIKKGLSDHKQVAAVLKRQNEDMNCGCGKTPCETYGEKDELDESSKAKRDAMRAMGKRGVDPADIDEPKASKKDKESAGKNIVIQLRKAKDSRGNVDIEFQDGKKQKVDPKIIDVMLKAYDMIPKPNDKEKFTKLISKSYRDMLKTTKMVSKQLRMGEEIELDEAYGKVKSGHYDVKVTVKDRDVSGVKKFIMNSSEYNNGEIEDVDSDQVDGGGNKFKGTGDIYIQGDGAGKLGMEIAKKFRGVKVMGEEVELEESKSSTGYDLYHKTFSGAMQHAYAFAKKKFGMEIDPEEIDNKVAMGPKKPSNGKTNSYRLKAKGSKKGIQVQVANLDNKRYELNMYKEEVELDEIKQGWALIDTADGNKVKALSSREQGVKQSKTSAERPPMSVKDKNTLKIIKLKKAVGDKQASRMIGYPLKEEVELQELTSAEKKLINQMYDKKGNLTPFGKKVMDHGKGKKEGVEPVQWPSQPLPEEMDPTDHVKKKGDKYCVYNADGSIAKEFDNKEDADKYAIANHDKMMATAKKEVKEGAENIVMTKGKMTRKVDDKTAKKMKRQGWKLQEEEEPNKPDSAKEVEKGRDDKKKTRIAQLQLQIAKAQETINKMNAQEK